MNTVKVTVTCMSIHSKEVLMSPGNFNAFLFRGKACKYTHTHTHKSGQEEQADGKRR